MQARPDSRLAHVEPVRDFLQAEVMVVMRHDDRSIGLVITAEDGASGIAAFVAAREELRLVLLDVTMPNTDGYGVLTRIRGEAPRLPVMLTSGHAEDHVMQRLSGKPRPRFLQKPFSLEELLLSVREALQR